MNALRIVGILVGLIVMVGFGMCGLLGLSFGFENRSNFNINMTLLGLAGLGISAGAAWGVYKLFRQLRARPPTQ